MALVDSFKDLGTTASIIQRKDLSSELLSSLFWLNLFFGFLTGGAMALCAPIIARLYHHAGLTPILQVLGSAVVISSGGLVNKALLQRQMSLTLGVIYMVKERTNWLLGWQILSGGFIIASFFCGLAWGVAGVASAYAVALAVLAYPAFAIPFRLIRLKFADLLSTLRPYAIATALMALQVIACRLVLEHLGAAISLVLIAGAITGTLVYAIFIFYMRPVALGDLQKMLK